MKNFLFIICVILLVAFAGCKKMASEKVVKPPVKKTIEQPVKTNAPAPEKVVEKVLGPPTNKVYLADLRGKVYFKNVYGKPRWGLDFSGKVLCFNDKKFKKGIMTHPPKEGEALGICKLDKKYRRFRSYIFVGAKKGSVTFRIEADGEEIFNSGEMTGENNPLFVDVDVTDVNELKLIANKGKDNFSDHAVWGDPYLLY